VARVVFVGTAAFAVPSLLALHRAGHTLPAIVTQPDRPHGRGGRIEPGPVHRAALALELNVLQPEKASDPGFIDQVRDLRPELIVVVAYGQILRPALLDVPPLGCINVHGSLLPLLRGAAPIQWAVIRGFRETGVTTMFMDPGMDTGDVILQAAEPIAPEDTAGSLAARLAPVGAGLLLETVSLIAQGTPPRSAQDASAATYAPALRREDGEVRWDEPAGAVRNRIHGCNPSPGAFTDRAGSRLKLWRAEALPGTSSAPPGTVLEGPELLLAAGEGVVRLLEVQPESRGRVAGDAFRRGYRVLPGERWGVGLGEAAHA
jgi:methionyl-tRNA formyltransferase